MPCKPIYTIDGSGSITVNCGPQDCPKYYKQVGLKFEAVQAKCMNVTEVAYDGSAFLLGKQSCVCTLPPINDGCQITLEGEGVPVKKLTKVMCKGVCGHYFEGSDETKPITVRCKLVIDHNESNKVKCVCVIIPKEELEKEKEKESQHKQEDKDKEKK